MSTIYKVELLDDSDNVVGTFEAPAGTTVLAAADEAGVELPSSCLAGVCTTCAAKVVSGEVEQLDAMGVSEELRKEGYALLCAAYPKSDLKIKADKEQEVYDRQFGAQ